MPKRSFGPSRSRAWRSASRACVIEVPAIEPDTSIIYSISTGRRFAGCTVGGKANKRKYVSPDPGSGERKSAVLGCLLSACRTPERNLCLVLSCRRQAPHDGGHP